MFGPYEFVVRRIHSLLGLVPVGAYMVLHLAINFSIVDGPLTYQRNVNQIHELGRTTVQAIVWIFILLPILFHGLVGLAIVLRGERNFVYYPYVANFRYSLQRWTGVIALLFIVYHVFEMNGWFEFGWWREHVALPLGGARFDPHDAAPTAAMAIQASALMGMFYTLGVLSCVYHFANGLWTAGITWGVWTTPHSQRWSSYLCGAFGVVLALISVVSLYNMMVFPVQRGTEQPATLERPVGKHTGT
jgi:succinate dehydrogenase / fumarate reductase, cytochrome b subunit